MRKKSANSGVIQRRNVELTNYVLPLLFKGHNYKHIVLVERQVKITRGHHNKLRQSNVHILNGMSEGVKQRGNSVRPQAELGRVWLIILEK